MLSEEVLVKTNKIVLKLRNLSERNKEVRDTFAEYSIIIAKEKFGSKKGLSYCKNI